MSVNSRSKAVNIGLVEPGIGAEEEGWGAGQPSVRVLGREVKVMRRWVYDPSEGGGNEGKGETQKEEAEVDTQETLKGDDYEVKRENDLHGGDSGVHRRAEEEPPLWGLDLEALRKGNGSLISGTGGQRHDGAGLPIYRADSARAYLLKSFASDTSSTTGHESGEKGALSKKATVGKEKKEKEENLAKLLSVLEILFESWAGVLGRDELDRRAWSWYVAVRPDVKDGVAGWGGKGEVNLGRVLEMVRKG